MEEETVVETPPWEAFKPANSGPWQDFAAPSGPWADFQSAPVDRAMRKADLQAQQAAARSELLPRLAGQLVEPSPPAGLYRDMEQGFAPTRPNTLEQFSQPLANPLNAQTVARGLDVLAGAAEFARQGAVNPNASTAMDERLARDVQPGVGSQIAAGVQQAAAGLTSPAGAGLMAATAGVGALPRLAQRGVSAGFAAWMAANAGTNAGELVNAFEADDVEGFARAATSLGMDATFATLSGLHAVKGIAGDRVPTGNTRPDGTPETRPAAYAQAVNRWLTGQVEKNFTPEQVRDMYRRVNTGEATAQEQELVRVINRQIESPGQALRQGVDVTTPGQPLVSPWLRDFLALTQGEPGVRLATRQRPANGQQPPVDPAAAPPSPFAGQGERAGVRGLLADRAQPSPPETVPPEAVVPSTATPASAGTPLSARPTPNPALQTLSPTPSAPTTATRGPTGAPAPVADVPRAGESLSPADPSKFNLQPSTLPDVPGVPSPLECQPYDTALRTRPEATMETRPAAPLGLQREPTVSPELADAIAAVRGGYNPEVEAQPETSNVQRPTSNAAQPTFTANVYRGISDKTPNDPGIYAEGTHYTTSKDYADTYGRLRGGKTIEARVELKRPFVTTPEGMVRWHMEQGFGLSNAAARTRVRLEELGYDGVVIRHPDNVAAEIAAGVPQHLLSPQFGDEVIVFQRQSAAPTAPAPKTPPDQSGVPTELTPPAKVPPSPDQTSALANVEGVGTFRHPQANEVLAKWDGPLRPTLSLKELQYLADIHGWKRSGTKSELSAALETKAKLLRRLEGESLESLQALSGEELKGLAKQADTFVKTKRATAAGLINWREKVKLERRNITKWLNAAFEVRQLIDQRQPVPNQLAVLSKGRRSLETEGYELDGEVWKYTGRPQTAMVDGVEYPFSQIQAMIDRRVKDIDVEEFILASAKERLQNPANPYAESDRQTVATNTQRIARLKAELEPIQQALAKAKAAQAKPAAQPGVAPTGAEPPAQPGGGQPTLAEGAAVGKVKKVRLGKSLAARFAAETERVGDDILAFIYEGGGMLSKAGAKAKGLERWKLIAPEYDDARPLALPWHNLIYRGQRTPDKVAQVAYEAGKLAEPSVPQLWQAISDASRRRRNSAGTASREEAFMQEETAALERWTKATESGKFAVTNEQLGVGDVLDVEGVRVEVTERNPETGRLTLQDGREFETQYLDDGQTIYVEAWVEKTPEGQPVVDDWDQPAANDFALNAPESVEEQKARLAQEQAQRDAQAQRDRLAELQAKPLTGTTGDLGQGDLLAGPQDLFAPPSPNLGAQPVPALPNWLAELVAEGAAAREMVRVLTETRGAKAAEPYALPNDRATKIEEAKTLAAQNGWDWAEVERQANEQLRGQPEHERRLQMVEELNRELAVARGIRQRGGSANASVGDFRAPVPARPAPVPEVPAGAGFADSGLFVDGVEVRLGGSGAVNPVLMPEVYRIYNALTGGDSPFLRRYRSANGMFYAAGAGRIGLHPDLFKFPHQAAYTFAHEVGHLGDYLPDRTLDRGNLFGSIGTLRHWLTTTFPLNPSTPLDDVLKGPERKKLYSRAYNETKRALGPRPNKEESEVDWAVWGEELSKRYQELVEEVIDERGLIPLKQVRDELLTLTQWWKPYDPATAPESYRKYRESARELYADALSVLFNSPGHLEQMAPTFYKMFWAWLDTKPEFKAALARTQELLAKGDAEVLRARVADDRADFEKGRAAFEAAHAEQERTFTDVRAITARLMRQFVDRGEALTELSAGPRLGGVLPQGMDPREAWEQMLMADNLIYQFSSAVAERVVKPLQDAGLNADTDIGVYLKHTRIQGNKSAREELDLIKARLGRATYTQAEKFADLMEELVRKGIAETQMIDRVILPAEAAGIEFDDITEISRLRLEQGTRVDIANPRLVQAAESERTLAQYLVDLGPAKAKALEQAAAAFRDIGFNLVEQGHAAQVFTDRQFETAKANRHTYAAFRPLDHVDTWVSWTMRRAKGSAKPIENPFVTTMLKMQGLAQAIMENRAKLATRDAMQPVESFVKAETYWTGRGQQAKPPAKDMARLIVREQGKPVAYDVDPAIAEAFEKLTPFEQDTAAAWVNWLFHKTLYRGYVSWSLPFNFWTNPNRDIRRTYLNLGAVFGKRAPSMTDLARAYKDAWADAKAYVAGELTPLSREAMEFYAIYAPTDAFYSQFPQDDPSHAIFVKLGLVSEPASKARAMADKVPVLKQALAVGDWVTRQGQQREAVGKLGTWLALRRAGFEPEQAAPFVRNYAGTPNTKVSGSGSAVPNAIFPFYRIWMQALRNWVKLVRNPKTRGGWMFRWAITTGTLRALLNLAGLGYFGMKLKDWIDGLPEYHRTRGVPMPLPPLALPGGDYGKKSIALKLPDDEFSALMGYSLDNAMRAAAGQKGVVQAASDAAAQWLTSAPALNTFADLTAQWLAYAGNGVPEDRFRNRPVLTDAERKAGGAQAFGKMVAFSLDKAGVPMLRQPASEPGSAAEQVLRFTPLLKDMVLVSDAGFREKDMAQRDAVEQVKYAIRMDYGDDTKYLLHRHAVLDRAGTTRTLAQEAEYAFLKRWHADYNRLDAAIVAAQQQNERGEAKERIRDLETASTAYKTAMEQAKAERERPAGPRAVPWSPRLTNAVPARR